MQRPRLYLDEDVFAGVAVGLRRRGFDLLTTVEAGRRGATDEEQLAHAVAEGRALFTFNRGDFAALHAQRLAASEHHHGIVSPQRAIGTVVRLLSVLLSTHSRSDLCDRLIWLAGASAE